MQLKRQLVNWKIGQKIIYRLNHGETKKKMYAYTIEERERHIDEVRRFKMHVIRATEI